MARGPRTDRKELAGAITAGQLEIGADDRGLVLSLPESATFPVASADVTATAQAVIDRVAVTLAPLDVGVRIEGHTDDTPIRTARYSSNWELSTARASAVVARFIDQRIDPRRLSAAGYGEFHPRASTPLPPAAPRTGAWTSSSSKPPVIELKRTAQERLLGRRVDAVLTTHDSGGFAGGAC